MQKKHDYLELYTVAKERGKEFVCKTYGISMGNMNAIIRIGDDLFKDRELPKNAKTLEEFTPRELMEELARRGYKGELQYMQKINIENF